MKDAFDIFDTDEDGIITKNDLYQVFVRIGVKKTSKKDVERMIDEVAPEANGYIDFDIFKELVNNYI